MNPEFTLTFWRESFGLLALQIAGVVAIAVIAHCFAKSASWRRSIWQIAIATAGLLTVAEWSGAGRNAINWAETQIVARQTSAMVHPSIPETTPSFQTLSAPILPISTSVESVRSEPLSDPLTTALPVTTRIEKAEEPPVTPAVWWPAWLWFIGFAVLSLRFLLLNSVFLLFRFFRRLPVDDALAARVQMLAPRLGLKRGVRLVALRGLTGPVAFGVLQPTIGVPPEYSRDFAPAEQDAMLAHELAHLSAHDPAWSWLADVVSAVLWWHPLIWIARRQLRAASETAADEASALLQDGPETLAECLVNLGAKLASGPVYGGMGVAESGFSSALGQRVERLLKLRPGSWQPQRRWTSLATKSFALTGLLIIAVGCGAWMSPRLSQPGPVMGAFWHSLDVSAISGLFIAQVDSPVSPARKPARAAASAQPAVPASVSGVVRLPGAPPPEIQVNLSQSELDVRGGKPLTTRHYLIGKDSGLANVVVYVKSGLPTQKFESPTEPIVLEARGLEWHPYVAVAQTGQTIKIRNLDQVMHNLHVTPHLNKEFNLAVPVEDRENKMSFSLPEMFIRIKGDVFPWMFAYVSVFDHPFFAVTDENGRFRFHQPLPPGTYEIEARHLKAGVVTQTITVGKDKNQEVDFTLSIPVGAAEVDSNVSIANRSTSAGLGIPQDKLTEYRETLAKIELLRNKEFELRSQYTEQNPLVKAVQQQIKASEEQKQKLEQETPKLIDYPQDRLKSIILVQDAKRLLEENKPDEADANLREAIKMDGSNQAAYYYLNLVREARQNGLGVKTNLLTSKPASTNLVSVSKGRQQIKDKLNRITINEVFYDNLPLGEVLKSIRDQSRNGDPDKIGINFFINPNADAPAAAPDPNLQTASPADLNTVVIKVNPALNNLRLGDVLDLIVKVADHPIKYTIEDYAIIFSPRTPDPLWLYTRIYNVDPKVFINGLTKAKAGNAPDQSKLASTPVDNKDLIIPPVSRNALLFDSPSQVKLDPPDLANDYLSRSGLPRGNGFGPTSATSPNRSSVTHEMVKEYFQKAGVDLTAPKTVFINDRNGVLMVRATLEDLEIIQSAIEKLNAEQASPASTAPTQYSAPPTTALPETKSKPGVKQDGDEPRSSNVYSTNAVGYIIYSNITATALAPTNSETLHTRTYKVDPNTFLRALERFNRGELGSPTGYQELVRRFFNNAGVDLAAPKSVFFNDRNGLLLARATLKDLEIIQQAIEILNSAPAQVTIEARFAELTESDKHALGFNWFAGVQNLSLQTNSLTPSKTNELAGTITGILTESQFRTVMKALEQRGGADILTAPRVTTLSGRQAQISAMDSKSIVTGVNSIKNPDGTVTNSPVVTPTLFGPTLDIIPTVGADGYSIRMTVTATMTEFLGYEKPDAAVVSSLGKVWTESTPLIPLPKSRTRLVTASAAVWDGQTLVLSGLISENVVKVKNKVPVVGDLPYFGRLFRSESQRPQKKNLLIFVTPIIIDPAGNRIHPEESLRSQQTIPSQK